MSETYVSHTKPWSRMQSLSESRRGSKVTKPIFSNSRKRYSCQNWSWMSLANTWANTHCQQFWRFLWLLICGRPPILHAIMHTVSMKGETFHWSQFLWSDLINLSLTKTSKNDIYRTDARICIYFNMQTLANLTDWCLFTWYWKHSAFFCSVTISRRA